jgi:predicted aspartyl protease
MLALLSVVLGGCSVSLGQPQTIAPGDGITVPIHVTRQDGATRIEADLTIDKHGPYTFVLDTGAETSAIDAVLARDLGLPHDGPPHQVGGVGGSVEAAPVKIDSWSLSKLKLPAMDIDSADLSGSLSDSEEGLLGADILSQFGTITINFTTSQLTVYKQIVS